MSEPPRSPATDPGVAWIRTRLAWGRTVLTLSVTAVLAARLGIRHGAGGAACAAVAIAGWGLAGLWALRRVRQLTGPTAPVSPGVLALGALFVSGYALLGLVLLFVF